MADNVTDFFNNVILRRSQQLFRFENGVIQQLVASLNRAKEEIKANLLKLEGTLIGPRGGQFSRTFLINRLNVQLAEIQVTLTRLASEQTGIMQSNMVDLSINEANAVTQMLQSQFGKLGINMTSIAFPQIDFITGNNLLGEQLNSSFLLMDQQAIRLMRDELLQSIIQGEDIAKATNRLVGVGRKLGGTVGNLMVSRAEMIARSELQFVSAQVSRRIYGENTDVLKGVIWSSALDRRTCLLPFINILTDKGKKQIRDIKVGDKVLTHEGRFRKVTNVMTSISEGYLRINLSNGNEICITKEHDVLVKNKQWKEIDELVDGDEIQGIDESVKIESIDNVDIETLVYDLEVEDDHSFVAEGIVVHNCLRCVSLDGTFYKLDPDTGAHNGPRIPLHPRCILSPNARIHTSKGIKRIVKIKVGDEVLTHKGHYKKVTELLRFEELYPEVVTIEIAYPRLSSNPKHKIKTKKLTITKDHPLLINDEWILAEYIKEGDSAKYLSTKCKHCGKPIPFDKKYCCSRCLKTKGTNEATTDELGFMDFKVISVKHWVVSGNYSEGPLGTKLYNFTVEDDESYIVSGFVSHNCRCTYVPITKSWQELGHVAKRPLNKREKAFFSSDRPPIETYDQWLKRQSTEIQKDVLGPTRFKAWKQGKIKLTQMATDKKIKTIKELGLDTAKIIAEFDTNLVR